MPQPDGAGLPRRQETAMLEAQALSKYFSGIPAVKDVNFVVRPGEVLGYLGPNGSGKTTTVGMVTGLLQPTRGRVLFDGHDIRDDVVGFRRRLGYVPEEPHLYPFLSGREYLELVGRLREIPDGVLTRKIDGLLDLFGLGADGNQSLESYSKGMRQKVLISAALMHDPDVIIFDEPLSGLDATSAVVFRHLVQAIARAGKVILYSSHVLEVVEKICTRVIVLYRGRVVADDSVERLRDLMARDTLEEVFAQLVFEEDPAALADEILGVMAMGR
jgi:ABC-2 type transport system ATP-binding protein